jgi:hypothetical protein
VTLDWNKCIESKIYEGKINVQELETDWWVDCSYLVSFLGSIVEVIFYNTTCS